MPRLSTWLGLLLVGLLLAGILIPTRPFCGRSKEESRSISVLSEISTACYIFRSEYGDFPQAKDAEPLWRQLCGDNPRHLRFYTAQDPKNPGFQDGWGRPILVRNRAGYLELRSGGKDEIYYTKDDIILDLSPEGLRLSVRRIN